MSEEYVELDRTFRELSLRGGDSDEFNYRNVLYGKGQSWSDLVAEHRTVILSEAGSGKTEEIRHVMQSLRAEGKSAFFLRLEHVADDFDIAFEEGTLADFDAWLASDHEGWIFLDSIDEARLREPRDFEKAIRKIGAKLSNSLQRSHVIITGRGTAWRPLSDLQLCERHLKYEVPATPESKSSGTQKNGEKTSFKIVSLDDLTREQVEKFATAKGITNPKEFLDAIERADAWPMAARPDDVSELVEFWEKNQRIGDRLELMRASIARRLIERDQTRAEAAPLSQADAEHGVRCVAAAVTMAQESTIRVPDGTANTKGIPVAPILPEWDEKKCAILLSRPVFDEAIYQTVRFHHRTDREYLTAEWFKVLLNRETSRRKIEGLFFRKQYGLDVITPAMRPVLVWLILLDEKVRERALAISPELIFEGGEPKALPLPTRQKILREVCARMHKGIPVNSAGDYRAVQRFADTDIAADLKGLLSKYAKSDDLQFFLLRMVWQGEVRDALPEALQVARNPKAGKYARVAAFRAVRAVGSDHDILDLRNGFVDEAETLRRSWFAELVEELPNTKDAVEWLLKCVAKLEPKEKFSSDGLAVALERYIEALDLKLLPALLEGLHTLIGEKPVVERRLCEISEKHGWLIKPATQVAERLVSAHHPVSLETPVLSILQKLPSVEVHRDYDLRDIRSDMGNLVPAWPELNRVLFWHEVAERRKLREKKNERVTGFWQVSMFGSYWRFTPDDFDWALSELKSQALLDDRLVALSLAFRIYVDSGRPAKWRSALKSAVKNDTELEAALERHLKPPPLSDEEKKWRKSEAQWKRRDAERAAREAKQAEQSKAVIAQHIDLLRNGLPHPTAITSHQHYLYNKMRELEPSSTTVWSVGNWEDLEPEFGPEIARAYRDGAVAYWRRYKPKLRSEGKVGNSTPLAVIFGLTGLIIEARETSDWPATLTAAEVENAFRYAMDELNGFPEWFPSLCAAFTEQVSELLLREIEYDLRTANTKNDSNYVLHDLSWNGTWAWPGIGEGVLKHLEAREPTNLNSLRYALNIVHGAGIDRTRIAHLAAKRSKDRRLDHAARWFAVWVGMEPDKAIPALAARLKSIGKKANRAKLAMQFVVHLVGGRRTSDVGSVADAFRNPAHLKALYKLMHEHIREKDDIHRAGTGAYSPGLRDDAQDARNQLFGLLKEVPGKEAYMALMELAQLHPEPSSRSWILHHAKTKAELDADLTPWSIAQTLEFQNVAERTPANHRELFELAEMRFLDLKDDLENGDSSVAEILAKGLSEETDMRKYIGGWLRDRAQGRYSVPQEEELSDAKKVDMRIFGVGFDAPVPAELKLAERWTGPKLFERLENQLCRDYLRDVRSNRGLFVVVKTNEKARWDLPDDKGKVDFNGLVQAHRDHWTAISDLFPGVDEVRVIGIDLTKRFDRQGV